MAAHFAVEPALVREVSMTEVLDRMGPSRIEIARAWAAYDISADQALDLIPPGSCPMWLGVEGGGWPADHRDHHLLERHAEALRSASALAAARRYDPAWRARAASWSAEEATADYRLIAPLMTAERDAADALIESLDAAPWGAQPDGSGGGANLTALRTAAEARAIREDERARAREAARRSPGGAPSTSRGWPP